ncbi:MFS transporter [Virgibacillus phasianinus]|uniref:MFS transporter n=1 Tax=Virgibacillus phasianinus TaxID=2017483 RepID=A0A220U4I4_9BACI|nr:MFS transporter [Virgibacillus phasianinus]ASK62633.1 MFS transporter [Virgibacillus phasianinus]
MKNVWHKRLQLLTGWITLFIIGTDLFVVSPLLPSIAEQYQITPSKAGWMVTAFSLMYALGAPWFGAFSDKWGRRKMITYGLIGFMIANVITGLAPTFSVLLGSRILAGLAASMVTSSVFAVTGDSAPSGKGGRWLAIVTSGFLTALWTGAPIGTVSAQIFGWQYIFYTLAIAAIALAILNVRVWPSQKSDLQKKPAVPKMGELGRILLDVAVTMFWAGAVYGLYTFLGTGLKSVNDFSSDLVAASLIVYGIGAIAGSLSGGRLADLWNIQAVSLFSLIALAVALALIGVLFSTWLWIWPLLAVWSFAGYVSFSSYQARLAQKYPDRLGTAMAWNQTAMYAGITLGSVFGGWIIKIWSFQALPLLCGAFALLGALWYLVRMKWADN